MQISHHPDTNLYCSLPLPGVKTETAIASQATFLKIFSLRYFLSYPKFPTKSGQNLKIHMQEITHGALSLVLWPCLTPRPDHGCAVLLTYCGAHWNQLIFFVCGIEVALVYSSCSPGRGDTCMEGLSKRIQLWAEAWSTAELYWRLEMMLSVTTSHRSCLLLPPHATFPQTTLSIGSKGFKTFMPITSVSLAAWNLQCTSTGAYAHTELVLLMDGCNWAEIASKMLFTFLLGLA